MKTSSVGASLHTKNVARSKKTGKQSSTTPSWMDQIASTDKESVVKRGVQASQRWQEGRASRVEELRAQAQAGTYKVDSKALAQSILKNESHFTEHNWE